MENLMSIFQMMRLFLMAAFGFERAEDAKEVQGLDIEPIYAGRKVYVQNGHPDNFGLSSYLTGITSSTKPEMKYIGRLDDERPNGSYNVLLAVEGPREVYSLNADHVPAYAVWSKFDGSTPAVAKWGNGMEAYAMRSGRGVIMSRELDYINRKLEKIRICMVGVEFSIYDSNPAKPDAVKLTKVFKETHCVIDPTQPVNFGYLFSDNFKPDQNWWHLINRAYMGLLNTAPALNPEEVKQMLFYHDQLRKMGSDNGHFEANARKGGWRWALGQVHEAWQLYVVQRLFLQLDTFQKPVHHGYSHESRFATMLELAVVSEERRAALWEMVNNFVRVINPRW